MDNIIELIIFLFIVYSIFSSFFGKKKPQQKPQSEIPRNRPTEGVPKRTSSRQDSIETLEELFGFKLPKTDDEFPQYKQTSTKQTETTSWDPEQEFRTKVSQRETKVNQQVEKPLPNINYDKLDLLEARSKRKFVKPSIKTSEQKKEFLPNARAKDIRKKLENPATIREMILISEILNKPKALRR